MKCLKCQSENLDNQKFCGECGAKLERICPNCSENNPPQYKFCGACGHNLTTPSEAPARELSLDEKIKKIQKYLPKGLIEKILSQREKIEGERKRVAVMFCDMEGFTRLSEKLGPEDAYSIMDKVYEILIHKVHDYEGTVNEMTGDGIMALFGSPIALEDASQRAIRSSLAIHREMAKFSDKLRQERESIHPLKMRIGIHTGPVVVGTLGNDLRVEFKAVGDTVNLASRMEGLAQPGSTYVTGETFSLTEGLFRFEAVGEKEVKGKKESIKVYRVIAPSARRTRFDVSAERGLTPFVGREREIELLMDGFERCKEERGQAFSIVSEAGVGKSRLLYEFRKTVANENVTFLEGKCLSYSRSVAYHPVTDILRSNFGIREGDRDLEIRKKVIGGLEVLKADEASLLPYLLELFSVKDSGIEKIPISPEMRRKRIIEALTRIILKGSEIRPLIMAIEDLHWIDPSSEESLKHILESISGARVLLIFTYRPEFVHTWGGRSYHNQLNLNRLSNRESLMMVSHLLGTNEPDKKLEALILEKTEGVPFFIEEFIKSLKNLNIIEMRESKYHLVKDAQNLTIPTTIQDVIMARVDSLPEKAKEVLQRCSVIEREFSYQLLQRVLKMPEQELLSYLSALKDFELLYERGIYPESTYIFKHALTREVVYDSILTAKKKNLHEKVGEAIEEISSERLEEVSEILAYQYSKSENLEKAYHYLKLSGDKATRSDSNWEAFRFCKEAINMLTYMPQNRENKGEQIEVRLLMATPIFLLGFPDDSLEILQEGERLSKELGDEKSHAHFLSLIAQYYSFKGEDLPIGVQYCEAAFKEAEKIDDLELMAPIAQDLCILYFRAGECSKIIDVAMKVIALLEKKQRQSESFGRIGNAYSALFAWYGLGMGMLGNFEEGEVLLEKSMSFAYKCNDLTALAMIEMHSGTMQNAKGDGKKAKTYFQNVIKYCEERQIVYALSIAWMRLGEAHCLMGELETARECIEKGLEIHIDVGTGFFLGYLLLSTVQMESGELENAQHSAEEALEISQKNHFKLAEGLSWILLGRILNKLGKTQNNKPEGYIVKGIKIIEDLKLKPFYTQGYHRLGELYADIGQKEKALENLNKAKRMFQEMDMHYWYARNQEVLARL